MVERLPGIFEFTLEEREHSALNIQLYLIRGNERDLLIDTAYGNDSCLRQMMAALAELEVQPDRLDVFLTHKHADHCGLARALQNKGATLYMNREEDRHLYDCLYYRMDHSNENAQRRVLTRNGITKELAPLFWNKFLDMNQHLAEQSGVWKMTMDDFSYEPIPAGKIFAYGDYRLEAIPLRGHTYGQMGLVDHEKKLVFAADQILNRTTPIVGTSHTDEHLLLCYLDSIADLALHYQDYTVIPSHEGPIQDIRATADRIRAAYDKKIAQVLDCVREDEQTVWDVARQVYGLTPDKRTDVAFYKAKMVTTKTFSMMEYLYDIGKIQRREEKGTLYWKRT